MRVIQIMLLVVVLSLSQTAIAQSLATGFLSRVSIVDGKEYRYQVYVPADYQSETAWPAILFLHGAGERGADGVLQTTAGIGPAIRRYPTRFPAIVVFPQAPADSDWVDTPAAVAMSALRQTLKDFHVDPDRVYLTGISMGGHGTWYLAYRNPNVFAALAPVCGWIVNPPYGKDLQPIVPVEDGPTFSALAHKLHHIPVWMFHGERDDVVSVEESRKSTVALKENGANVRYTEYLDLGHNCWDATYASKTFVSWLFAQHRQRP